MISLASWIVLAMLWAPRASDCADCRGDTRRPVLCAKHVEAERTTLREQGQVFDKSEVPDQRIAALEKVAALTREHDNARSPYVARFLADGLEDGSLRVRRRALTLLLDRQHREETTRGVIEGWKEAQKTWRVLDAKLVLADAPGESGKNSVAVTIAELSEVPDYIEDVLRALGRLHDDRALNALHTFSRSPLDRTPGRFLVVTAESLLEIDTRRSCELVVDLLDELEAAFVEGEVPRRFNADPRVDLLASLKMPLENATVHEYAAIVAALEDYAQKKRLELPQADEEAPRAAEWKQWYRSVRDRLPDKTHHEE